MGRSSQKKDNTLCKYFLDKGICIYQSKCWFKHILPKDSTSCLEYQNFNNINYTVSSEGNYSDCIKEKIPKSEIVCKFYVKKSCKYGNQCFYKHSKSDSDSSLILYNNSNPLSLQQGSSDVYVREIMYQTLNIQNYFVSKKKGSETSSFLFSKPPFYNHFEKKSYTFNPKEQKYTNNFYDVSYNYSKLNNDNCNNKLLLNDIISYSKAKLNKNKYQLLSEGHIMDSNLDGVLRIFDNHNILFNQS